MSSRRNRSCWAEGVVVKERVADKKGTKIQLPTTETIQLRTFGVARLGEKTIFSCGKGSMRSVEILIRPYSEVAED